MSGRRDQYVGKLKTKLDEWNADIDRLQEKAAQAAAAARKEYDEQIGGLRDRRGDLEEKLRALAVTAGSAWEDMREGVDGAAEALGAAIRAAKARFGGSAGKSSGT